MPRYLMEWVAVEFGCFYKPSSDFESQISDTWTPVGRKVKPFCLSVKVDVSHFFFMEELTNVKGVHSNNEEKKKPLLFLPVKYLQLWFNSCRSRYFWNCAVIYRSHRIKKQITCFKNWHLDNFHNQQTTFVTDFLKRGEIKPKQCARGHFTGGKRNNNNNHSVATLRYTVII